MIRRLLIIIAGGAIVSVVCFSLVHMLGGFGSVFHHKVHITSDDNTPAVTRDLPWTGGESLHFDNSAAHITYIEGPTPRITVSGPKRRIDKMAMNGDTVTGTDVEWTFDDDDSDEIHITVTSPNTHVFYLSGVESLTLANFTQDNLDLHISGAAHVVATGHAKQAEINMSGAGRLDLAQMPVDNIKVDISGAGSATLDPKQSADISISGAGHVRLLTRPPTLHENIAGVGSISAPDGPPVAAVGAYHNDEDKKGDDGKKGDASKTDKDDKDDD